MLANATHCNHTSAYIKKKLPPRPAENTTSAARIAMRKDKAYAKKKGNKTKTKNMRPKKY